MKFTPILTAGEMRAVDRRTIEAGIPGIVLMENAGSRVVDLLAREFAPLSDQRIVIYCGKGNNGGDGLVVARQLLTRFAPRSLDVILAARPEELTGDAAVNLHMFQVAGGQLCQELPPAARAATLVVDALLGTGIRGPASGQYAALIDEINTAFPAARVVAVDIPSGLPHAPAVRANYTVTFVAPKLDQVVAPHYERCGQLSVGRIGVPDAYLDDVALRLSSAAEIQPLFAARVRDSNKGRYGHALIVGGARGKSGATQMAGLAALRAGAGLVTVASDSPDLAVPELMTMPLGDSPELAGKNVIAIGPGLGGGHAPLVRRWFAETPLPMVIDADGLNSLAGSDFRGSAGLRVLTPHPGEMSRLGGLATADVQRDRLGLAREFAAERNVVLVLKGDRTVVALPDGRAWINPTGTPALATAGTGDVLTGLCAGLIAQFPDRAELAVIAAVWLHGRAGELAEREWGEKALIATDLLRYLPEAMREAAAG